jgi:hypothetical protein
MKKLKLLQIFALAAGLMFLTGNVWGQTTIFHECVPTFTEIPSGWTSDQGSQTQTVFQGATGGYLLVYADDAWVITSAYDLSGYTDIELVVDIASYGSGDFNPLRIDVSNDNGTSWTHQTFNTNLTTGTKYQTQGPYSVTASGTQVKFRFWRDAESGRGVRFRNIKLEGTISSGTPLITVSPSSLSGFTYLEGDGPSAEQSFTVQGSDLTADITVTPPASYEISETSGSGFTGSPITLTQTDGSVAETTIWVRLIAGLSPGAYDEDITCTSTDAADKTVSCSGTVTTPVSLPYSEDFSDCGTQEWIAVSVASDRDWTCGSGYQEINGFGGDEPSDDYLISPVFNLDLTSDEVLTFESWTRFTDVTYPRVELLYTTNYSGDPLTTTWNNSLNASVTWSAENSQVWTPSGLIDISGISGTAVRFAFHYTSSGTGGGSTSQWRIDDINIFEATTPLLSAAPVSLSGFSYVEGDGPSSPQSFEVSGTNLNGTDVTVTAPANFQVSDAETGAFGSSVTLTAFDGAVTDIWVRLAAGLSAGSYDGNVGISGGGATTINVAVEGNVTPPPPPPISIDAADFFYAQDFNTLAQSGTNSWSDGDIPGWLWQGNSARDPNQYGYIANNGTSNTAAGHSYGAADDSARAIGALTGSGHDIYIGVKFKNDTDDPIELSDILISYAGEQWRQTTNAQSLEFSYQISASNVSDITTGTWTPNTNLDFTAPQTGTAGTLDGNDAANRQVFTNIPLEAATKTSLQPGEYLALRWYKTGTTSPGLAVDDFSITIGELSIEEPSNHVTNFSAEANSSSEITVAWEHNDGDVPAGSYLILAKTGTGEFYDVASGTFVEDDLDWSDNRAAINVERNELSSQSYQWTGLQPATQYDFLIYPYNGTGDNVNYKTDGDVPDAQETTDAPPGLPYAQDFSGFTSAENLPEEFVLDDTYIYQGDFGSGTAGGLRGNGALGFQLTGSAPNNNFTATLSLINNTGEEINELFIKYTGLVERVDQTGTPKWVVSVNGTEYSELEYLTADGVNKDVFAIISGLAIADNDLIEVEWFTTSIGTSGTRRQIGITDVAIEVPVEYNGITDPENLPPDATVTISGNQTLEVPLQVKNLIIEENNSLIISPVGTLSVTDFIGSSAGANGLVIKSDATGTGSLVHSTPGLQGTSERFIPSHGAKSATGWHFLSSPVNNFAIGSSDFVPGTNDDFFAWDEETNTWLNYKVGTNNITHFVDGEGYLVAYAGDITGVFTGTFNVGDVAVDLSLTSTKDGYNGWNLLGNPYPSAIDWSVVGNHTDTFEDVFAYVYNRDKDGGAGYEEIDGSQQDAFIPANQGFFVKTKANQTFTITNEMRAHGGTYMKTVSADDRIVLRFSGDYYFDQTTIRLRNSSQFERDGLDALKMFSFDTEVPQIYTLTSDQRGVAINSIPSVDESLVIPIGLLVPSNGMMTITLDELTGEFEHQTILLIDQKTSKIHKLNDAPTYTFEASTGDDPNRFLLKFESVSVNEIGDASALHIYANGSTVYLNSSENLDARIAFYNITGQQVHGQRLVLDGLKQISLNLPTGWYVVSVTSDKEMTTQKVFIR